MEIALTPVDAVTITTVMDNSVDLMLADDGPAHRRTLMALPPLEAPFTDGEGPDGLIAEHGFSALISMQRDGLRRNVLFDTGVSENGAVENMRRLDLSPKDIEAIVLSHGHIDHTAGLVGIARMLGRPNLPVILHPEFWTSRRIAMPGREPYELPTTSKTALRGAGFEVIEEQQPSFLLDGALLVTGEVDRTTEFEQGFPPHQALRDGEWAPDPLILDDQAVVMNVRDRGLVVLTGCGHAGVVNIIRHAMRLSGVSQLYAVIGGFHLTGGLFEAIIPQTVSALVELSPQVVVPAHCTGFRAMHELARAFPDAFIQNSVGTTLEL